MLTSLGDSSKSARDSLIMILFLYIFQFQPKKSRNDALSSKDSAEEEVFIDASDGANQALLKQTFLPGNEDNVKHVKRSR